MKLLKAIYISLCQSILSYCISVWGGTSKSHLMLLERAQRSVLKVMLKKPIRFPTEDLYKEADLLSVRGLYVLYAIISTHKVVISSPSYCDWLKLRVFKIPSTGCKTSFARRSQKFMFPYLYNKIANKYQLQHNTTREAKVKVRKLIASMNYYQLEQLLRTIC